MCKFWFNGFLSVTKNYKYVIRIDEDCVIFKFPLDDLMEKFRESNVKYMTPSVYASEDSIGVTNGLKEFSISYASSIGKDNNLRFNHNPYTNIFIMDADYFRSNQVFNNFSRFIDESKCIFINRWGDLPLWGIILSLMDCSIIYIASQVKYYHSSHQLKVN